MVIRRISDQSHAWVILAISLVMVVAPLVAEAAGAWRVPGLV